MNKSVVVQVMSEGLITRQQAIQHLVMIPPAIATEQFRPMVVQEVHT